MDAAAQIEPRSTALVLNDLQLAIISNSPLAPSEAEAVTRFNSAVLQCAKALTAARCVGMHVAHVRVAFSAGYAQANLHSPMMRFIREKELLLDGAPATAFDPRVEPDAAEIVITKRGVSAFSGTALDEALRARGVSAVVLGGLVAHYAVEGTAREAHDRGYRVLVLKDACASATVSRYDAALANLAFLGEVLTTEAFLGRLEGTS